MADLIRDRRGTEAQWALSTYVLGLGEIGYITDSVPPTIMIGDGVRASTDLERFLLDADMAQEVVDRNAAIAAQSVIDDGKYLSNDVVTAQQAKHERAMRAFHVALGSISTTAVDVLFPVGDSIVAGAWASNWRNTFFNVLKDKMRRGIQPASIQGGAGYQFLGNTFLGGGPIGGATGTTASDVTNGLGRTALTMQPAATLSIIANCTGFDVLFTKGGGSFTYVVDGGTPSSPVSTAGSGHGKYSAYGIAPGNHTIVITISAGSAVTIEGMMFYNGDELGGLRMWAGAHSGYAASDFVASVQWAESIPLVPNPKLVVISVGSNDFFAGRTVAQAKADIQSIIATVRTKITNPFSIALMAYYDRPAPLAVAPWSDFVKMYQEIATGDDNIDLLNLGPIFGPLVSDTDDRGGLTTATPGDYVHPTNAGHALIGEALAEFVLPTGSEASGGVFNNTLDADKPVSAAQALAIAAVADLGDRGLVVNVPGFSGAMVFSAYAPIVGKHFVISLVGNATFNITGIPAYVAGKSGSFYITFVQDATGSRTLTLTGFKRPGGVLTLSTAANARDLIEIKWDGTNYWAFPLAMNGS